MAREDTRILDSGDAFPEMEFTLVDGGKTKVPADMGSDWKVVLIFRGYF